MPRYKPTPAKLREDAQGLLRVLESYDITTTRPEARIQLAECAVAGAIVPLEGRKRKVVFMPSQDSYERSADRIIVVDPLGKNPSITIDVRTNDEHAEIMVRCTQLLPGYKAITGRYESIDQEKQFPDPNGLYAILTELGSLARLQEA